MLGLYVYPVIKEVKYKNTCIRLSEKGVLNKIKRDNIQQKLLKDLKPKKNIAYDNHIFCKINLVLEYFRDIHLLNIYIV